MKNNLKILRREKKLSQQELGQRLDVSRQTINALEKGKFDPSLPLTIKIVRFFKKDLESIAIDNLTKPSDFIKLRAETDSSALKKKFSNRQINIIFR